MARDAARRRWLHACTMRASGACFPTLGPATLGRVWGTGRSSAVYSQFLKGFPESFASVIKPEQMSRANGGAGTIVFPARYAAPEPASIRGNAHPNTGEADVPVPKARAERVKI